MKLIPDFGSLFGRASLKKKISDFVPVGKVLPGGIFLSGGEYSKTYRFTDINYRLMSEEGKKEIYDAYSSFLGSLGNGASVKITVVRRPGIDVKPQESERNEEGLRGEYFSLVRRKMRESEKTLTEKFITFSCRAERRSEAESVFSGCFAHAHGFFKSAGSTLSEVDGREKLLILASFLDRNVKDCPKSGGEYAPSDLDIIMPDGIRVRDDCVETGGRFLRLMYIKNYPSYLGDTLIEDLTAAVSDGAVSVDIFPVPTEKALKEAKKRLLGVQTNIYSWLKKQKQGQGVSVPYDMAMQEKESEEFLKSLTEHDNKMLLVSVTVLVSADDREGLEKETGAVRAAAVKNMAQAGILRYVQDEALGSVLPFASSKLGLERTFTSGSAAILTPFSFRGCRDPGGLFYGTNILDGGVITVDRRKLLNGNSFILGVSGSGKSFASKFEIASVMLSTGADVIIIDPEREYGGVVKALGGENIVISPTSRNHINALDISRDYGDGENPVSLKSEFILSVFDQLSGGVPVGPAEKSLIDRCVRNIYSAMSRRDYTGAVPTLKTLRAELTKQGDSRSEYLSLLLEIFTDGTLDTFSKKTNVNISNRLVSFDISSLGEQLAPLAMLITLDFIYNRICANREIGRETYIFIDEIYLLFRNSYASEFLFKLWKRVRKYGAYCTGITQNVEDLLQSSTARAMLANSELIILFSQAKTDLDRLSEILKLSDNLKYYVTNSSPGRGLIKIGGSVIPFSNRIPEDSSIYGLMNTDGTSGN